MSGDTELPVEDTVDVRSGPEVAEELLAVLPLLGEWHGEGQAAGAGGCLLYTSPSPRDS